MMIYVEIGYLVSEPYNCDRRKTSGERYMDRTDGSIKKAFKDDCKMRSPCNRDIDIDSLFFHRDIRHMFYIYGAIMLALHKQHKETRKTISLNKHI